jgi:hypothetical protein
MQMPMMGYGMHPGMMGATGCLTCTTGPSSIAVEKYDDL